MGTGSPGIKTEVEAGDKSGVQLRGWICRGFNGEGGVQSYRQRCDSVQMMREENRTIQVGTEGRSREHCKQKE